MDADTNHLIPMHQGGFFDGANPIAIQERAICENPAAGPDGIGVRTDGLAYTPEARQVPQAIAFSCKDSGADAGEVGPTLRAMGGVVPNAGGQVAIAFHPTQDPISSTDGTTHAMGCGSSGGTATVAVAFAQNQLGEVREAEVFNTLQSNSNASGRNTPLLRSRMAVRRLTPRECERLQGFPDDHTNIPWRGSATSPDGPRYKAIGNSWAIPCVRWIGERIKAENSKL